MKLTLYTDYSLRVLIYAATFPDRLVSTQEISKAYDISTNHLVKVVNNLGHHGILELRRGRSGGLRLGKPPEEINVGTIVRLTENDFDIVECFSHESNQCSITPICGLKAPLREASKAFLTVLDKYTLADIVNERTQKHYEKIFLAG